MHPGRVSADGLRKPVYRELVYSWTIVGRKGGRLEKAILQLKNMHYSHRSMQHTRRKRDDLLPQ